MAKRTATTELNHDNWGDEDEPETAGVFVRASSDELKKRQIRTARRRGIVPAGNDSANDNDEQNAPKSVFAGFSGFKKTEPVSTKAVFSFLAATPNGGGSKPDTASSSSTPGSSSLNDNEKKSINGVDSVTDSSSKSNDKEYFRKLKGLNESVSKWISTHVASNPLVILTPVFKDYERHLANIQSKACPDDNKLNEGVSSLEGSASTQNDSRKEAAPREEADQISSTEVAEKVDIKANEEKKTFSGSIFGSPSNNSGPRIGATFSLSSSSEATPTPPLSFCFGASSTSNPLGSTPTFSFGSASTTSPSAGFSFGNAKPFVFSNVASANNSDDKKDDNDDAEDDTPPKPDHTPVNEEGATYSKRCKVFIKQGKEYSDRGIGNLFLKPVDGGKTQLIVRADTSLGNVLLNFIVGSSLPVQRLGTNNVAVVCIPTPEAKPPPVTVLLRVKTSDDADELFNTLEKHKKEVA